MGNSRSQPNFEGWYFKHQGPEGGFAVIPAIHTDRAGRSSASVQVITPSGSSTARFPAEQFRVQRGPAVVPGVPLEVRVGNNVFSSRGLRLDLRAGSTHLRGELRYGPITPLGSDIMGPFRRVPGMECSHGVLSMGHRLEGGVTLNGTHMDLSGGTGYLETDRGRSFPRRYLWTQCAWDEPAGSSLMLSIAHIPYLGISFTGCICAVLYGGREYRLATYRGAKASEWSAKGAVVRQGPYRLDAELLSAAPQPLWAPASGSMERVIHESLFAAVRYRFWKGDALLFDHVDSRASFEYADTE